MRIECDRQTAGELADLLADAEFYDPTPRQEAMLEDLVQALRDTERKPSAVTANV